MSDYKISNTRESGNAVVFVLVALLLVVVGMGAYLNMDKFTDTNTDAASPAEKMAQSEPAAQGDETAQNEEAAAQKPEETPFEIKQGNPVVAKIGEQEVKRADVLNYIRKLPSNLQQLEPQQLFPLATTQVVNAELIGKKAKAAKLDNDPAVKAQLEAAKEQIVRTVFIQKEVQKKLNDDRLKTAYEEYRKAFPKIDEVKAAHILVKDEATAQDIIKKLNEGGDFTALAKEYSLDGTKDNGGDLNYFSEKDVVPEFSKAAFALKPGEMTKEPVKTQFGYHVIKVQDKRLRPVPEFEEAKPFLAAQLQNVILEEILQKWRAAEKVEIFDINGDKLEPAAGEE